MTNISRSSTMFPRSLASGLQGLRGLRSLWPIAALLLVWQLATSAGLVAPNLLPSPLTIAGRLFEQLHSAEFLFDIGQTLVRLFAGFGLALALGVLLGLVMALGGEFLLAPMVRLLSPIPKIALYPALVLLLGFGHASKIGLVVSEAVFPIMLATFHGVRSVQPKLVWSARAAGAGRLAVVLTVLLPSAFGSILTGCRIGLVVACINVFLAEMISSTDGLGHLLVMAARSYQVVDMFVPLVLISTIGLCLNSSLQYVRRRHASAGA